MTSLANLQAPSLDDFEALAQDAYARLPEAFRRLCEGVVIRVEDFPDDETMEEMGCETPFDLLGTSGQPPRRLLLNRIAKVLPQFLRAAEQARQAARVEQDYVS